MTNKPGYEELEQRIKELEKEAEKRTQFEQALRESEEKYRNVVERANDVIIIVQDQLVKYTNQLSFKMTGYEPEEVIGQPLMNFVHPDMDQPGAENAGETPPQTAPPPTRPKPVAQPFVRQTRKIGRNEPCPCGSGRKYKQCHGRLSA